MLLAEAGSLGAGWVGLGPATAACSGILELVAVVFSEADVALLDSLLEDYALLVIRCLGPLAAERVLLRRPVGACLLLLLASRCELIDTAALSWFAVVLGGLLLVQLNGFFGVVDARLVALLEEVLLPDFRLD